MKVYLHIIAEVENSDNQHFYMMTSIPELSKEEHPIVCFPTEEGQLRFYMGSTNYILEEGSLVPIIEVFGMGQQSITAAKIEPLVRKGWFIEEPSAELNTSKFKKK